MRKKLNRLWLTAMKKAVASQRKSADWLIKSTASVNKASIPKREKNKSSAVSRREPIGTWTSGCHRFSGTAPALHYYLFLPDVPSCEIPLVVMLHGCRQNAEEFAMGTRMNIHSSARGFAVLYPEQSIRSQFQRCWRWYAKTIQKGGNEVAALTSMIDYVTSKHAIDCNRIYVCGISAGAAMAHILALTRPDLIAAVGLHSGPAYGGCNSVADAYRVMQQGSRRPISAINDVLSGLPPQNPVPAILIAGSSDPVVRPVNHSQLVEQFVALNQSHGLIPLPARELLYGRTSKKHPTKRRLKISDYVKGRKVIVRSVMIEGLGHAWSGGDTAYPFNATGPNASTIMLDFFASHRKAV